MSATVRFAVMPVGRTSPPDVTSTEAGLRSGTERSDQVDPGRSGRAGETRTPDPLAPSQVRYQTAPQPWCVGSLMLPRRPTSTPMSCGRRRTSRRTAVHEVDDEQHDQQLGSATGRPPRRHRWPERARALPGRRRSPGTRPPAVHRRRRPVLRAVLAPGHVGTYSVRLRTRSFSGVAPKSNASRMLRSR